MKKYLSLELAVAFFMLTITFYFAGIFINFDFKRANLNESMIEITAEKENVPNAEPTYAEAISTLPKIVDVIFFYYNGEPTPTLNSERIDTLLEPLNFFSSYLNAISNSKASIQFNVVQSSGSPLLLEIPNSLYTSKAEIYDQIEYQIPNSITLKDDTIYVYLNYSSFENDSEFMATTQWETNTSGLYSLDYTRADSKGYYLIHSDALTARTIDKNNFSGTPSSLYNKSATALFKNLLSLYGLPILSVGTDTSFAGNHSILSGGTHFAEFNPVYSFLVNKTYADLTATDDFSSNLGWLSNDYEVVKVKKETTIVFDPTIGAKKKLYFIMPSTEEYNNQVIFVYYVPSMTAQEWTNNELEENYPPEDGFAVVARVNFKKNEDNTAFLNASEDFIPFYVFQKENAESRTDTVYNSALKNINDVVGYTDSRYENSAPHFGYVSLLSGENYTNSTLTFTVIAQNPTLQIKIECADEKSSVLPPISNTINQSLNSISTTLAPDVRIYLYNKYVEANASSLLVQYSQSDISNLTYTGKLETSEDTWNDFYQGNRQSIYDDITTLDFVNLKVLDLYGCRDVTSLQFLEAIDFSSVTKLCLSGIDLSNSNTDKTQSNTSLSYVVGLKNLQILEMNSCKLVDINYLGDYVGADGTEKSELVRVSVMDNDLTSLDVFNANCFNKLTYINATLNQLSKTALETKYKGSQTVDFYHSANIDIGIQRLPREEYTQKTGNFAFKDKVQDSNITNPILTLNHSPSFDPSHASAVILNNANASSSEMIEHNLQHGLYNIGDINYYSLLDYPIGATTTQRQILSRDINCYFTTFTYAEEEICQTPVEEQYNFALNAYNDLNPLINYDPTRFKNYSHEVYEVNTDINVSSAFLSLNRPCKYRIDYSFTFADSISTTFENNTLVISKYVNVLPYYPIVFDNSETPATDTINDPMLYKTLLYIAGKGGANISSIASIQESQLGTEENYTLYNQDFYFLKVENKHIPSIYDLRLKQDPKGVLSDLDISGPAQTIARVGLSNTQPLPEVIISSIAGLNLFNLSAIESLNLNVLGLTTITPLFNASVLPQIRVLNAGGNQIKDIENIHNLATLEYIDLSFNKIENAEPLKRLSDPGFNEDLALQETQTLKKVNLSFNMISIKGNRRTNEQNEMPYNNGNNKNKFLIDDKIVLPGFLPQNQIYIVLVQMLSNFDHYANTSKWEYYYTPAVQFKKANNTFISIYNVKYATSNSNPTTPLNGYFETQYANNYASYTDYLKQAGNYSITSTITQDATNYIPFRPFNKTYYFTVSDVCLKLLTETYNEFPTNPLLQNATQEMDLYSNITYTLLSTEYAEFIQKLSERNPQVAFTPHKTDLNLHLDKMSPYWRYNSVTGAGYNFYDAADVDAPLKIFLRPNDQSNNGNVDNLFNELSYTINFYSADTRAINDTLTNNRKLVDRINLVIRVNIINNPVIELKDDNLKDALLRNLGKNETDTNIFAYDFFNTETLDLSNSMISTFETLSQQIGVSGFDSLVFNKLKSINLSNNIIVEDENTSCNTLTNLFSNTSIFPQNILEVTKLEYLDLSFNKISFLPNIQVRLFDRPIIINLFGNIIEFNKSFSNLEVISSLEFTDRTQTRATVFIGVQNLKSSPEQKIISYTKDIHESKDTSAKFFFVTGNFPIGINDISYSFEGADIEYINTLGQITDNETDSLYRIYYYKNAFYEGNQNFTVTYKFKYGDYIDIDINATIIHQKIYFAIDVDEFGNIIKEYDNVYKEFHTDYDLEAFNEYNQAILDEDIFVYENSTPDDFTFSSRILDAFGTEIHTILSNLLTIDPYTQKITITHKETGIAGTKDKKIHIVDSTAPEIQTNSNDSQNKYVIIRGSTYAPFNANKIDKDLVFVDDYDNYMSDKFPDSSTPPIIRVTIIKDGEEISCVEGEWNTSMRGMSINCNEPGIYEVKYVAIDSQGNESEEYVRIIEVYYQPYSYIRINDFSAMFSAGKTKLTASVYKSIEDENRNTNPIFYWYLDGNFVGSSTISTDTPSTSSTMTTSIEFFVEGAGTHSIEVFVDITKEAYEENMELGLADSLSSSTKATSLYILMDNKVLSSVLIVAGIIVLLVIILIIILVIIKRKKNATRNKYTYTIIKKGK